MVENMRCIVIKSTKVTMQRLGTLVSIVMKLLQLTINLGVVYMCMLMMTLIGCHYC